MFYIYLKHFFDPTEAIDASNKIQTYLANIKKPNNAESWLRIDDDTLNTHTLIVHVPIYSPDDLSDEGLKKIVEIFEDYFTCITYDYAEKFIFSFSQDIKQIKPDKFQIKNDFNFKYPKIKEEEFQPLLPRLIYLSNFIFLIKTFHNRGIHAFRNMSSLDKEISEDLNWKLPETVDDSLLEKMELWLDNSGRDYYQIKSNHNLILTHSKNIQTVIKKVKEQYNVEIDISPFQVLSDELELKYLNSETIYERVKDLKDLSMGKIEIKKMDLNTELQKELVGIQKYSNRIQQSAVIIEAFIVYAYTFYIWVHVNEEGLKNSPLYLKFIVPLMVAVGAVLFVEFARELDYGWLEKFNNHPSLKSAIFLIISLILIAGGIWFISLSH